MGGQEYLNKLEARAEEGKHMTDTSLPFAEKKFTEVKGHRMACIDVGEGAPIVFQHGNPTSSYLWRNVMPACRGLGRLIACDLIGMGDSWVTRTSCPIPVPIVTRTPSSGTFSLPFGKNSNWVTTLSSFSMTGAPRSVSIGRISITIGSRDSPIWKLSSCPWRGAN